MLKLCRRCGTLVAAADWQAHRQAHLNALKPSTTVRGYGSPHRRLRAQWAQVVAGGGVRCARCAQPIMPGEDWQLDHFDRDKSRYLGPSHQHCNQATAGR